MHRQTVYAYENPSETDFLYAERFAYEALGLALMDILGVSTLVAGLACTPTGPASLNVNVGPGRIYSVQNLEPTAWGLFNVGGLPADTNTDHNILKQGLWRDTTAFPMPAPGTTGQAINYLVQASFSEVDAQPISLPFVSATPPYASVAPNTLNTVRQDKCVVSTKAGTGAVSGSQTTPAPDAGCVGLYVVTVAFGQTTITSGNISLYSGAPFITETLTQKISQPSGDARYLQIANAPAKLTANTSFYLASAGSGGSDSNTGLTSGSPWLTLQHALNVITNNYLQNGFGITIQQADGTYANDATLNNANFSITLSGNTGAPTNVKNTGQISCTGGVLLVQNMQLSGSSYGLSCSNAGVIEIGAGISFQATVNAHMVCGLGGLIQVQQPYTVTGGGVAHVANQHGGRTIYSAGANVTFTGTPAFSSATMSAIGLSEIYFGDVPITFTGAVTGSRYAVTGNSLINTNGSGEDYIPGSSPGAFNTGGQYA